MNEKRSDDVPANGFLLRGVTPRMTSRELLERWSNVQAISGKALRDDINAVVSLDL